MPVALTNSSFDHAVCPKLTAVHEQRCSQVVHS